MAEQPAAAPPEGIFSILDTDLYKLTMQCCVLKHFPRVSVTYNFTNRTRDMKLNRAAFNWLQLQIEKLADVYLSDDEFRFLKHNCPYLGDEYLQYLLKFRFDPSAQVHAAFSPIKDTGSEGDLGDVELKIAGLWVETILYEIPLLALVSEAYFKFCDRDWDYSGQLEAAYNKGMHLLDNGCLFSEFGSRRRRDYHTHDLVIQGLVKASNEATAKGAGGKLQGTSNVHFAMRYEIPPVGTVAHEWFMGVAAISNDYENANELSLRYWVDTFGEGVLGIALTDTFGTPTFLKAFRRPISKVSDPLPRVDDSKDESILNDSDQDRTYAAVFAGVRQDSGDPEEFVQVMRKFYDSEGIKNKKTMVFSDSLNLELCLKYKEAAEVEGFRPTFGVGTFLTNDFVSKSSGKKSVPLNIVIKLASASGRAAVKISDNVGKNTGDAATVAEVKQRLGYQEKEWEGGDETKRWGSSKN